MYNGGSQSTLYNIHFSGNSAGEFGGGLYNFSSHASLRNITFSDNSALQRGGGIYNNLSNPSLTNVSISGNSAEHGGGMYNSENSNPGINNVTIFDNSATQGGGIFNSYSNPTVLNSIVWGNAPDSITGSAADVTYSVIQYGYIGLGNIDADPLFGLPEEIPHFPIYPLLPGSPAIDAGNPDSSMCPPTDQRGVNRPQDGDGDGRRICDIGAYEYINEDVEFELFFLPLIFK